MPGLDGQKMSKSYNNSISLRESPDEVEKKIRTMPTDPARVRRTDDILDIPVAVITRQYMDDLAAVENIINEGCEAARDVARDTMEEVRKAMGLTLR